MYRLRSVRCRGLGGLLTPLTPSRSVERLEVAMELEALPRGAGRARVTVLQTVRTWNRLAAAEGDKEGLRQQLYLG